MAEEKTQAARLKEQLFYDPDPATKAMTGEQKQAAMTYAEGYRDFLCEVKTEREAVTFAVKQAEAAGFLPFDPNESLKPGDKRYLNNRGKALILCVVGTEGVENGISIAAAHIDSPRLDLKPNPLYEDHELAYFDTHYYGGIKKYQWTAIPLALHGVVVRADGTSVPVCIGEDPQDPVFCVTDLLPHLSAEQMKRAAGEIVKGEDLNLLIGSFPFNADEESEQVKLNILHILHEKYGITEADFRSAELEIVPAFPARDLGLDRSMIGAYGHDDRVCAYPALTAVLAQKTPRLTALTVLADKEEIGSEGNTGMQSSFLIDFIEDLAAAQGCCGRHVAARSLCLSADVNAAFDPIYPEVAEQRNFSYLNHGVVLTKYTGARGKYDTSDASAETMGTVRRLMEQSGVVWQIGELGRVDIGGGGTVTKYIANHNIDTVDLGVPVLSMHAPFEIIAKLDVYMAHKAFAAFFAR